jgi:Neocarzinostatin family
MHTGRWVVPAALLLLLAGSGTLAFAATAGAAGTLTVTPSTGLANGDTVSVSGSGFANSSTGGVLECNDDPGQPTIQLAGNAVPVSCTSPLSKLVTTTSSGDLPTTSFTIVEGTVGPPTSGTDSSGGSAATDAANYPCPPTPAQVTAGDSCVIAFGDQAGDQATQDISFSTGGGGGTTTTTTSTTTTTTTQPTTTTTSASCAAKSTTSSGSPSLTADPGTCLNGGTVVTVTGSGFDASSAGAILECNGDSSQPTVALPAPISQAVPVGCSGISAAGLITTTSSGTFSATFSIGAGTVGPPCGGSDLVTCPPSDSTGHTPSADAAAYPCPPTAAQLAAGVTCVLAFGDAGGKQATVPISFVPAPTAAAPAAATTAAATSTGSAGSASATSGSPTTVPSSGQPLAFTGVGPGLWLLGVSGLVLINLGVVALALYYRPREMLAVAGRGVLRLVGRR